MIRAFVRRAVLIVVAAAAAAALAEQVGPWAAVLTCAAAAAVACGLGVLLLRTSTIGRVTWRNRAAGYLIPWGWRLNRGRLGPVAILSWLVWTALAAAAVLLRAGEDGIGFRVALLAAWVADAATLMFVLGSIRQATPGSRTGSLWRLAAVLTLLLAASVGLYLGGFSTAALGVGGGPPLVVLACAGLALLALATVGRNARWN